MTELLVIYFMVFAAASFLGCLLFYHLNNPPPQNDTFPDAW
jgi:hypothetical protein